MIPQYKNTFIRNAHGKLKAASHITKGALLSAAFSKNLCLRIEEKKNPLFNSIELETTSVCNRKCSYCPNSNVQRPAGYMSEELFFKIVDELAEIKYSGRFSPHFYGEPLVDRRIVKFISYARNKLPNAFIKLYTNGDLLTHDIFMKLLDAGVDVFRISQHDEMPSAAYAELFQKIDRKTRYHHIEYVKYFDNDDFLMNRSGLIEVKHDVKMKFCERVAGVTIDYEGNALICCQDYLSKYSFGNINTEKILDAWNKNNYKSLRDKIKCGVWPLEICKICNGEKNVNNTLPVF